MNTKFNQQRNLFQAKLQHNALLQLVFTIGVAYILLHGVKVILIIISSNPKSVFPTEVLPNLALQPFDTFLKRPWVLLTYFWGHASFWNLVSNMLWLYCFGSVLQTLIGYKEIITLFVSSCIIGALFYLMATYFFPGFTNGLILTSLPGVVAFATAAIVFAPKFRFYLGERFAIPLWVVLLVFVFLNLFSYFQDTGLMILIGFSALSAATYIFMLKIGYHPGAKIYQLLGGVNSKFTPDPYKIPSAGRRSSFKNLPPGETASEKIDKILDKINRKGYTSLSEDEKETLRKASEEIS